MNRQKSKQAKGKAWEPDARQLEIYHAYVSGGTVRSVAATFGMARSSAHLLVSKVNAWLVPQWMSDIRDLKTEHAERLMEVYREAMAGWERSKVPAVTRRAGVGPQGAVDVTTTAGQTGDPRYLAEARAALREIRDIWGANAPARVQVNHEHRLAGKSPEEAKAAIFGRLRELMAPKEN